MLQGHIFHRWFMCNMQLERLSLPMDVRVRAKLCHLVACGVRRLPEVRRHLQHFVTDELFAGRSPPAASDARFWPSSRSLLNVMHQAITANRSSFTHV